MSNRGSEYRITQPREGINTQRAQKVRNICLEWSRRTLERAGAKASKQRRICKVLGVNGSVCLPELPTGKANYA